MSDQQHTPTPLRLGPLLRKSTRVLAANHRSFIALALIPVLWKTVFETLSVWLYGEESPLYRLSIGLVIEICLWTIFAVGMYRAVLIGSHVIGKIVHVRWGRREWLSLAYSLVLSAMSLIGLVIALFIVWLLYQSSAVASFDSPDITPDTVDWAAAVLFFSAFVLISARFYFLFPAIAVDTKTGFRQSWAETKGVYLILVGATFLPLLISFVFLFAEMKLE